MVAWQAPDREVEALVGGRHADPFALLGPHETKSGLVIRAFVPDAATLQAVEADGKVVAELTCRHPAGFFEGLVKGRPAWARYRLRARNDGGTWELDDPYSFGPALGPLDDHLLVEGTHRQLYERLGAHICTHEDVEGTRFAVWAPNAARVSVVGDFNRWDGRTHQMRKRVDSGLWEIFAPGVGEGTIYKYEIISGDGRLLPLKADPFGFKGELRPATGSVVARVDNFEWHDEAHITARAQGAAREKPMAIYEVHLGSWRRGEGNRWLTYDELADDLVGYAAWMGFTHIELLPVSEHPLDASWGYQPIGLFAPTSRFGDPAGFARFVDKAHQAGLSVILDWVPAHFPTDIHGLAHFDGTPLYEHADPRRGFHPDWNTAIYDFGRREVANMLIANALYWLDRFHVDGLRVDAVASMLYLNYSRREGEWSPNPDGSNDNKDAVGFLQRANETIYAEHPGTVIVAEESTSWAGVSAPVYAGGLGFGFKWNMGWMHDTLDYTKLDPVYRTWHHDKLTFGLVYAFSENFVLPLSHDEVVHGKGTVLTRMPGDDWQRFATVRAYYALMWAYPGKKLLFMGQEFAQRHEWSEERSLDWHLLGMGPHHQGVQKLVRELNLVYRAEIALHAHDCAPEGFRWIVVDDAEQSVFAWARFGREGDPPVVMVANFTPVPRPFYRIGLPRTGLWREILNTDAGDYGGSGVGNLGGVVAVEQGAHGMPASAEIVLPPLATLYFRWEPPAASAEAANIPKSKGE
ncbi:1,4-alpha-glucan branching protein GlgB [Ancylobacter sp. MQZ15Z-1]|uniref:1,4-alpha-glucan branching enzyme GlgB n=1 Tax=Ancylobacter mangrovi TaxID=2972472 RepID=A0A9X2PJK4_9HYPH|nr:1,4-alpha-glucan branching protein GlgB [Ancylobacter mangrovi]MCS0496367.1 1,4-alpha-glucan branching protein GlgB [Ancylobacter mangrovi]